jgi:hypothetical protein
MRALLLAHKDHKDQVEQQVLKDRKELLVPKDHKDQVV